MAVDHKILVILYLILKFQLPKSVILYKYKIKIYKNFCIFFTSILMEASIYIALIFIYFSLDKSLEEFYY